MWVCDCEPHEEITRAMREVVRCISRGAEPACKWCIATRQSLRQGGTAEDVDRERWRITANAKFRLMSPAQQAECLKNMPTYESYIAARQAAAE